MKIKINFEGKRDREISKKRQLDIIKNDMRTAGVCEDGGRRDRLK